MNKKHSHTDSLVAALEYRLLGELHTAKTNFYNYLFNPVAIGEHPDLVEEAYKLLEQCESATSKIEMLRTLINDE